MGNTSSQVQDEAPDAPQHSGPQDQPKLKNGDGATASSQAGPEAQTATTPAYEKEGKEKKSKEKKSKKNKKRKNREEASDAHPDEQRTPASQGDGCASSAGNGVTVDRRESSGANQGATPQAEEQQPRESRRKRKDKNAAQNAAPIDTPASTDDAVDAGKTEPAMGEKAANKKRKRKSADAAPSAMANTSLPAAQADSASAEDGQSAEDSSRRKQKSTRSAAAAAPAQVKNTPIPIPTFNPPTTKEQEAIPIRKSKRKADADAAKNTQAEKASAQDTPVKDKRSHNVHGQVAKDSEKKPKKSRKAQQDSAVASTNQELPLQPNMNSVELSVIDPALLPPAQQQAPVENPASHAAEEASSREKSKKSKKSQVGTVTPVAQEVAAAVNVDSPASGTANATNGLDNGTEVTGERAYIDHQKKKQKRKRQTEDAAVTEAAQQADVAEPKPKKRKKASEKDAGTKSGTAASSAKGQGWGARPEGTEDFPSSGPYTKKEVETLTRAIEVYREYNDLNQVQVNDIVQAGVFNEVHGKSCKEFWDDICPCLPNRWSRETIIKFVRRKWHNFDKRGKWDPEEDQLLREAYSKTPGQWTKIGEAVGRFADDCRDRWRNYLSCSETMASKRWHDSEVNELLNVVQDCLNTLLERLPDEKKNYWREELQSTERRDIWRPDEIRNLVRKMPDCMDALRTAFEEKHPRESKQKRATEKRRGSSATDGSVVINWDLVSEKMGKKRSRLQIMSKWKALEHSYSQDPKETFFTEANHWRVENGQKWAEQMLPGDKYNIVRAMMDLGLTNEERIIWNSVAHHELVKLKWAHQAKMTFLSMKDLVPQQESLPQLLQSLKDHFEVSHGDQLDNHWRYEGRPGRGSLKSATYSPGPLDWRGHMRGESSYKSNARVTDDDEDEESGEAMKME